MIAAWWVLVAAHASENPVELSCHPTNRALVEVHNKGPFVMDILVPGEPANRCEPGRCRPIDLRNRPLGDVRVVYAEESYVGFERHSLDVARARMLGDPSSVRGVSEGAKLICIDWLAEAEARTAKSQTPRALMSWLATQADCDAVARTETVAAALAGLRSSIRENEVAKRTSDQGEWRLAEPRRFKRPVGDAVPMWSFGAGVAGFVAGLADGWRQTALPTSAPTWHASVSVAFTPGWALGYTSIYQRAYAGLAVGSDAFELPKGDYDVQGRYTTGDAASWYPLAAWYTAGLNYRRLSAELVLRTAGTRGAWFVDGTVGYHLFREAYVTLPADDATSAFVDAGISKADETLAFGVMDGGLSRYYGDIVFAARTDDKVRGGYVGLGQRVFGVCGAPPGGETGFRDTVSGSLLAAPCGVALATYLEIGVEVRTAHANAADRCKP